MDLSVRFKNFQYIGKDMHKLTKCRPLRANMENVSNVIKLWF